MRAIAVHLRPLGFSVPQSSRAVIGGYFTWLTLPEKLKTAAEALARRCREEGDVIIAAGKIFEVPGDDGVQFEGNVRLCWSWEEEDRLEEGVKKIGLVAMKMLEEVESGNVEEFVVVEKEGADGVGEFK
jgi:DNA-binding transcriptional MocR family regulator